jgi:hypothetical protein
MAAAHELFAPRDVMRTGNRQEHVIGGDLHDGPMPMAHSVWLCAHAAHPDLIIPGHDPLIMRRYPPPPAPLKCIAVRLDAAPSQ